jgi:ELWxxDGT repeat protein
MIRWPWPGSLPRFTFGSRSGSQSQRPQKARRSAAKPCLKLELLEDRTVPSPVLIQEINAYTLDSNPQDYVAIGNTTYFIADDGLNGPGIWKTDGTTLTLVVSGATAYQPSDLTNVNGIIYFAASDSTHGDELWKFDGTSASLVADIRPGTVGSNPSLLTNVNGTLYFAANDGTHGIELWKYDGTTASLVVDINPGVFGSGPHDLTNINGSLFFGEPSGSNDSLYVTDSTSAHLVATFRSVGHFTNFNGTLFFAGDDGTGTRGNELWKSTGTATNLVTDINAGAGSSNPYDLTVFNNALYFGANDGTHGNELWDTNGTGFQWSLVSATAPDTWNTMAVVNSTLFYSGSDATHGDELWKSDGTSSSLVTDINPGSANSYPAYLTNFNGTLYFAADDGTHGKELWKSDGTATTLVDDIFPGTTNSFPNSSNPNNMAVINGLLFFAANDGVHGNELWTTDGSTAGTRLFQDINLAGAGSDPRSMTNVNGTIFFSANDGVHGYELWKTDGNTATLFDLNPGPDGSRPLLLTNFNGQLYFEAGDDVNGSQLWKCDGTNASIVNFEPGIVTSPGWLTVSNGLLFFSANDGSYNSQLWKTDGTNTTVIPINSTGASNPNHLMVVNGLLYFVATDGVHGNHLWTTDGTTTTMLPFDLDNLYINLNLNTFQFVYVNGWFYFVASDPATGSELWRTDGTTANLVADINPGANGSNPQFLTAANGRVFFSANDGTHGTELWESDGTTTSLVADVYSGVNSSQPLFLTNVNGTLFFGAYDPTDGNGLWQTTGTGVTLVGSYDPTALTAINGLLYFEAIQGPQPYSLYSTNGTTTTFVSDFTGLTVQDTFLNVNSTLYFEGSDAPHGFEPWKLALTQTSVSQLQLSVTPTSGVAGSSFNVTVTAQDGSGHTVTTYNGTVHFTSSDSQAVLPSDYTFTTADAGVHSFTVVLKTAGTPTVTATDTAINSITGTVSATVTAATASTFSLTGFPTPVLSGQAQTFTVTARDAFSNIATGYTGTAHFTSTDSAGLLPADYTFTATDAGVHTLTGTLETAGTQSLTVTDSIAASITGSETGILVKPAIFLVSGYPSLTISGVAQTFSVTAENANGTTATGYTGTVHFTSSDSAATLPADYSFTATDAGVHTFSAMLQTAGTQSLTATDAAMSSVTGTEAGILVKPSSFLVSGFPSPTNAGTAHNFTVTAQNANGTTATGYTGTVHFTSSDAQAVLPADSTLTNGTGTFSATLKTAGTQSLTATDTVTSSITGTQSGITVNPLSASTLTVAGFPSPVTAGVANNFTVTAKDVYGNTATGYRGTVRFTSTDTKAALPASYIFTSTDSGVHTFTATLKTVGTQSITATDIRTITITGTQSGITVNPASASAFSVTGFPSPIVAGTAGSFTVTAKDAFGNVATGYQGTVKFSSSDQRAVLAANYTFVAADSGVHTFTNGATLKTAGTQSITASDTVTSSIRGTQNGIVVTASSTSMLLVSGFPSPSTAGTAGSVTVTAADAYGNKTTSYLGTVHFTSTDAQAVLPADYTFTSTDNGVHTFTNGVTLKTAGNQSITATDTVTSSITGKQTVGVTPAAAATLQVSGYPSPTTAGAPHTFTVKAKDAYGNVATGYLGTVTFTSSDAKAVLPANYTFVANDHGVHTFSATLKTAGNQSLTATDTVTSSITGTQLGIVVNAAAASVLAVTGFPSPIAHGTSGTFTVTVEDAYGNVVTGYHGTVKFSSSDAAASLPANYTFTSADAGVHTFTATLNTVGTQSITATDTVTSSITGTQSGIQVTAASVDALFRDWSPGSTEVDSFLELLKNPDAAEQLALALGTPDFAGAVRRDRVEEIRTCRTAGSPSALGAAALILGLHWRDRTTRRTGPRGTSKEGLEAGSD